MHEFGQMLKDARIATGKTQLDLGQELNISHSLISQVESGQRTLGAQKAFDLIFSLNIPPEKQLTFLFLASGLSLEQISVIFEMSNIEFQTYRDQPIFLSNTVDISLRISPDGNTEIVSSRKIEE